MRTIGASIAILASLAIPLGLGSASCTKAQATAAGGVVGPATTAVACNLAPILSGNAVAAVACAGDDLALLTAIISALTSAPAPAALAADIRLVPVTMPSGSTAWVSASIAAQVQAALNAQPKAARK